MADFGNNFATGLNTGDWYQLSTTGGAVANQTINTIYAQGFNDYTATSTVPFGTIAYPLGMQAPTLDGSKTLEVIKGAIHEIKDETVSEEAKTEVESKVNKYKRAGFARQATILETELKARIKLARIKEWNYKVLPYKAVKAYDRSMVNGWTMNVHIDPVDKYIGVPEGSVQEGEFDKIVPEHVIDSLLTAKDRQVFDEFAVLWVEKVKDPLLLGKVKELPDYFLIDEWGTDIKFSDILKASKKKDVK